MAEHSNAKIARALWLATARGDAETVRRLFAEDVVWVIRSGGDLTGELQGREAAVMLMARAGETVDDLHSTLLNVYANDDGFVLRYRVEAERGGVCLDTEILLTARTKDGQVTRAETVPADAERNERFWTSH